MKAISAVPVFVGFWGLGVLTVSGTSQPSTATGRYEKYDEYFRKYSKAYFDDRGDPVSWQLLKAQAIVESNLRPDIVSPEHAVGLMQLTPGTYEAVRQQMHQENKRLGRQKNRELGDPRDPESNIAAGIWHDHEQWVLWKPKSEGKYHREFMLASYNAGPRPLQRAQEVAQSQKMNHRQWPTIVKVAPKVKGWRSEETIPYVDSVIRDTGSLDKDGRVVGPVISKVDDAGRFVKNVGGFLATQLKKLPLLRLFHRGDGE